MPVVIVKLAEGRTQDQKKTLVQKVTAAISESVNAKPESITIFIEETKKDHLASGGVLFSDK